MLNFPGLPTLHAYKLDTKIKDLQPIGEPWRDKTILFVQTLWSGFEELVKLPYFSERYQSEISVLAHSISQSSGEIEASDLDFFCFLLACHFREFSLKSTIPSDFNDSLRAILETLCDSAIGLNKARFDHVKYRIPFLVADHDLDLKRIEIENSIRFLESEQRNFVIQRKTELEKQFSPYEENLNRVISWDKDFSVWQGKFEAMLAHLRADYQQVNFLGISKAFSRLSKQKRNEFRIQTAVVGFLSLLMVGVPTASLSAHLFFGLDIENTLDAVSIYAPIFALEFVLIYLFRATSVTLQSIRAQRLQLDLRVSICAFIEGYSEFSSQIRSAENPNALDKFEALIFSGIPVSPDKVPSQFDGLDQILKLIRAWKSDEKKDGS